MAELRRRVALVPQEVELFEGTIRDNVTLFDDEPTDEAVIDALTRAGLGTLAGSGIHRALGAGGAGMSAGESQLLALARVWLRQPDLVVLDEATARIDPVTEQRLEAAVAQLIEGRTTFIIAHKLSTLRMVDEVIVFDHGRIVEHDQREVLARSGSSRWRQLLELALEAGPRRRPPGGAGMTDVTDPSTPPTRSRSARSTCRSGASPGAPRSTSRARSGSAGWRSSCSSRCPRSPATSSPVASARCPTATPTAVYWFAFGVAVAETVRMGSVHFGAVTWTRAWAHMQTLLRANLLTAQVASGGPEAGQPVGSAGEALTHFRDDTEDIAMLVDGIVDVSGGLVFTVAAGFLLGSANALGAAVLLIPLAGVVLTTKALDGRIKRYRADDREATAAVTGLVGDIMAAATTVKVNNSTDAMLARLRGLVDVRRRTAVRDRVLDEGVMAFSQGAADVGLGLVLLVSAGALASGAFDVETLALFVAYLGWLSFLPRMVGRMLARRKQAVDRRRPHAPARRRTRRREPVVATRAADRAPPARRPPAARSPGAGAARGARGPRAVGALPRWRGRARHHVRDAPRRLRRADRPGRRRQEHAAACRARAVVAGRGRRRGALERRRRCATAPRSSCRRTRRSCRRCRSSCRTRCATTSASDRCATTTSPGR